MTRTTVEFEVSAPVSWIIFVEFDESEKAHYEHHFYNLCPLI
jgi:hypothetical protein